MGLLHKLESRLELHRLEKKYTTRRRTIPTSPTAQYVDGEYIYHTPTTSTSPHSSSQSHQSSQYTSSSSTFATSQQHQQPYSASPPAISFTSSPPPPSNHWTASGPTKHTSWHSSLRYSGISSSNNNNNSSNLTPSSSSTLTTESPSATVMISRNSRGQTWEPPKQGWGGDGTDAFKEDKKEFRFDVEGDRGSWGRD